MQIRQRNQRTSSMFLRGFLNAMLILAVQSINANAQLSVAQDRVRQAHPIVSQQTYDSVLDILFPRNDPDPGKTVFAFVLRFKPHSQPESQIVIRRGVDKVTVVEYKSLDGDIYVKLNESLERTGREDPVEMAKAIKIKRREISVPYALIKQWYAGFFDSLANGTKPLRQKGEEFDNTGGSETIFLHGGVYALWYQQRLNQMSFSLYDVDVDNPNSSGELMLVRWMNSVRRQIGKSK